MNGLPYYKAYPRDFMEATVGWPLDLKGAYRLVLDLIYMHNGRLPDDPRFISGHLGCSVRAWNGYRKTLIEKGKLTLTDGLLSNYRADNELIITRSFQDKQRENATGDRKNKGLVEATALPDGSHTEPDTDIDDDDGSASAREPEICQPEPDTIRSKILAAIGVDPVSGMHGPNGKVLGSQADMLAAGQWIALGLTEAEILTCIAETMAGKRDGPPNSFRYFTKPMEQFAGAKASAATKLIPSEVHHGANYNHQSSGSGANRHGAGLTAGFAAVANRIGGRA